MTTAPTKPLQERVSDAIEESIVSSNLTVPTIVDHFALTRTSIRCTRSDCEVIRGEELVLQMGSGPQDPVLVRRFVQNHRHGVMP